jgi:hypothetical protein
MPSVRVYGRPMWLGPCITLYSYPLGLALINTVIWYHARFPPSPVSRRRLPPSHRCTSPRRARPHGRRAAAALPLPLHLPSPLFLGAGRFLWRASRRRCPWPRCSRRGGLRGRRRGRSCRCVCSPRRGRSHRCVYSPRRGRPPSPSPPPSSCRRCIPADAQALVAGTWGPFPASPALGPAWGPLVGLSPLRAPPRPLRLWRMRFPQGLPVWTTLPRRSHRHLTLISRFLHRSPLRDTPSPPSPLLVRNTRHDRPGCGKRPSCGSATARPPTLSLLKLPRRNSSSPAAHDSGVTSSATMGSVYGVPTTPTVGTGPRTIPTMLWHDPTDPLVAQLHLQAGSVQNIRLMVPVVLEPESPSYAR